MNNSETSKSALTAKQKRLLMKRVREQLKHDAKQNQKKVEQQIKQRTGDLSVAPMSFSQQRLWLVEQLQGSSAAYNIPSVLKLTGVLNVEVLTRAINEIVSRHESLRTCLMIRDEQPCQSICASLNIDVVQIDIQTEAETSQADADSLLAEYIAQDALLPFELTKVPLIRVHLFKLSTTEHVLLLNLHHAITDGWSHGLLVGELTVLYHSFVQGKASPLPQPHLQYGDFAAWQRESEHKLEQQMTFWQQYLSDCPDLLALPTDRTRPAVQDMQGASIDFGLSGELLAQIKSFSRGASSTLFMFMLATFKLLLAIYSGQRDILVGTPVANRSRVEFESMIGFFVNTLVLRNKLDFSGDFYQLLSQVRQSYLDTFDHQDVPFEQLVEVLKPTRSLSHSPLFQVMFVLQNHDKQRLNSEPTSSSITASDPQQLQITGMAQQSQVAKFDITITLSETPQGLLGGIEYRESLFDASTIKRMIEHYQQLIVAVLAKPHQALEQLSWLSAKERSWLLMDRSGCQLPPRKMNDDVVALVCRQAQQNPQALALVDEGQQLNYAQLWHRAQALSQVLCSYGVKRESAVGIYLPRCIDGIIAQLAVWLAGGCYVPLDPQLPDARLQFIIDDANIKWVVSQSDCDLLTTEHNTPQLLNITSLMGEEQHLKSCTTEWLKPTILPAQLAYIIYTSGSTGVPKGVGISHESLANLVLWHKEQFNLNHQSVATHMAGVGFDAAVWELWPNLACGSQVVIVNDMQRIDARALFETLTKHQVTHSFMSTPVAQMMLRQSWPDGLALQYLLCGGEQLSAYGQSEHKFQLINNYGPTESTVVTTSTKVDYIQGKLPPIGKPISHIEVYVLDKWLEPVAKGVVGQLYIGGAGLARGYMADVALTAQSFVPNPYSRMGGERIYQSGDLVRWLDNGQLEYMGRVDQQLKIRGLRVELGEIEAVLNECITVAEAAVVAQGEAPHQQLVAYVVGTSDTIELEPLHARLKQSLPEYMQPTHIIILEKLPMTANGKLDKRSLPEPQSSQTATDEPPATAMEILLADIWKQVLGIQSVGIHANFFEIGGHSLLVTQVVSRLEQFHGLVIEVKTLFAYPTIAQLARQLELLTVQESVDRKPLVAVSRDEPLPLSYAQQRMWFLQQLDDTMSAYHIPMAYRLKGYLDIDALNASFGQLLARHESLRTTFVEHLEQPVQLIGDVSFAPIVVEKLANPQMAERIVAEQAAAAFDLSRGPLIRMRVLQLAEHDQILLLTLHHIITDGWSMTILMRELRSFYQACINGETLSLPPLDIQYGDFCYWQQHTDDKSNLDQQLDYWRDKLTGLPPLLVLPYDRPRGAVADNTGAQLSFSLSTEVLELAKQVSSQQQASLFMTLLCGFKVLLARYSGERDIAVGSPVANRSRVETEPLIGLFVNTLVLRDDINEQLSFNQLLAQIKDSCLQAFEHQDIPFEQLVDALNPQRTLAHSPLFQVMFDLHADQGTTEAVAEGFGDCSMEAFNQQLAISKFDLSLTLAPTNQGLIGSFEYATSLFDSATIERLAGHFGQLLANVLTFPNTPLNRLSMFTQEQYQHCLQPVETPRFDYHKDKCVHWLFEIQAKLTPDAIAVSFEHQQLSYQQLNRKADSIARHLLDRGFSSGQRLAIAMSRSPEYIISILAVLKIGGCYVPLDVNNPIQRNRFIIEDAQVVGVLTTGEQQALFEGEQGLVDITAHMQHDAEPIKRCGLALAEAYVIYTSGSTGTPKGVPITHQALLDHNHFAMRRYGINSRDKVLQFSTFCFDISIEEVFPTLLCGATLVLYPDHLGIDIDTFESIIENEQLTVVNLPTAYWRLWTSELTANSAQKCRRLKTVIVGGESAQASTLGQWQQVMGVDIDWFNTYGPTEATVVASVLSPPKRAIDTKVAVPIGEAVDNAQLYILNHYMEPVPQGVVGQLYIGSISLSPGYLNRPDLSAAAFVPNPFSQTPGARLYQSGDLVRRLPNNEIEFIGRVDHQVKIRGFRIEIGELESVLGQHPQVNDVVVMVKLDTQQNKHLVAYIVWNVDGEPFSKEASSNEPFSHARLKTWLKQHLPEHMIPSWIIKLDVMPLNANGKIDRNALPEVDMVHNVDAQYRPPQTLTQTMLADIWTDVLGLTRVGIDDDFFTIGGHSLLAIKIVSRIASVDGKSVGVKVLFEHPTIQSLATYIDNIESDSSAGGPITPISREGGVVLSFAQQRLWFLEQLNGPSAAYNMPMALRLTGQLSIDALEHSLTLLLSRHEILRTRFVSKTIDGQSQAMQIIVPATEVKLSLRPVESIEQAQQISDEDAQQSFDLTTGPLFRYQLLRLNQNEHVLILNQHHIISDGWSSAVMFYELISAYNGYVTNTKVDLPDLPIQYADFAHWQRQWLQGEALTQRLDYWQQKLQGLIPLLPLPTDRPYPPVADLKGHSVNFALSLTTQNRLQQFSRQQGVTVFMTVMAVFKLLLARLSGQNDIAVGTPVANRSRVELEPLLGFFVNTLVMRDKVDQQLCFNQWLSVVKQTCVEAYNHQDIPFEHLVELINPERSLSHSPLFQVMLVLNNQSEQEQNLEFEQVQWQPLSQPLNVAKFSLILNLTESADGLIGSMQYATALFDQSTIERMIGYFGQLLETTLAQPELPLWQSSIAIEPQASVGELVEVEQVVDVECFDLLFERQASLTANTTALVWQQQSVSYQQLNLRVNRLAHYLLNEGVGRGSVVALCLERGIDMVVSILAVLKTAAAYVPLDSQQSQIRLGYIINNAKPQLVICHRSTTDRQGFENLPKLILDQAFDQQLLAQNSEDPNVPRSGNDIAYLLYTSGSTGQPKGVMISHRNVLNLAVGLRQVLNEGAYPQPCHWAWNAPYTFDASLQGLLQLTDGGTLYIIPSQLRSDHQGLLTYLQSHPLDIVDATPSQIEVLLDCVDASSTESLPGMIIGGDTISASLWQKLSEYYCQSKFTAINVYGPTECTVNSTFSLIATNTTPNIGQPLSNVQCYILDDYLNPVPQGVIGELYLAGEGVAYGYCLQGDLSSSAFIPDPFSGNHGARLYRSGDLVCQLNDKTLAFIGRNDHQVKIRGFRIEPDEINSALSQHAGVQESVVIASQSSRGDKQLVAYAVVNSATSTEQLKGWLENRLPTYMVPAHFVLLDDMPLNANGKIDRQRLPAVDINALIKKTYVTPRNEDEELIAQIWADILGLERVGIDDNFFDLGGHSLLATRVVAKLADLRTIELPVRALFESPTVRGLTQTMHQYAVQGDNPLKAIVAVERDTLLPLSFAQQRLWFLNQLEGPSNTYNMSSILRFEGTLNVAALSFSLSQLLLRHESLRTRFVQHEQQPQQIIDEAVTLTLVAHPVESQAELSTMIEGFSQQLFDLAEGPLFRANLWQLTENEHILGLSMHHIVSDGWSMELMLNELLVLYRCYELGESSPLPPLTIGYADFAHWQRQNLQNEQLQRQLDYWQQQLVDAPPLLAMPTDKPRPAIMDFKGRTVHFEVPSSLLEQAKKLSNAEGCTLFMTLLAVFKLLLARYSGQNDIIVGTPVANRPRTELEGLVGFFVNTLVLRDKVDLSASFDMLIEQVKRTCLDGYSNQDIPFENIVEAVKPQRSLSFTPLFQVMFVLQRSAIGQGEVSQQNHQPLPGLKLSPVETEDGEVSKFDLTLSLAERGDGLTAALEYRTGLFEHQSVERMSEHFIVLLQEVLAQPTQPMRQLRMLDQGAQTQMLQAQVLNEGAKQNQVLRQYSTIDQLIAIQSEQQPDKIALAHNNINISYAGLNISANRLAKLLRERGVGVETAVGVCMERSALLYITVLAVWKAGGVYVPLEPSHPMQRLDFIVADAQVSLCLCDVDNEYSFTDRHLNLDTMIIEPAMLTAEVAGETEMNHLVNLHQDNLAYMIYTSGTTGIPKGTMLTHGGLVNLALSQSYRFEVDTHTRMMQFASIGFDASISEIVISLVAGATLVSADLHQLSLGIDLIHTLNAQRVTHVTLPPSGLTVLTEQRFKSAYLTHLITAGESCDHQLIEHWSNQVKMFNAYGPTETTVCATMSTVNRAHSNDIGLPLDNTQVYVLDDSLNLVPPMVVGQLFIAGSGLARGYQGRASLTANLFIPNPFSAVSGQRLYQTGDQVRWLTDGTLEFIGRTDKQMKIRGFRIEPAEIEAVLIKQPGVSQAVLVATEDNLVDKQLLAYITVTDKVDVEQIKVQLSHKLPHFMVPQLIIEVEQMPLTVNGKVDIKALPKPDIMARLEHQYVAPRSPDEQQMADIWAAVIGVARVGIEDDFFTIGGHSLLAVKLVDKVSQQWQIELPLAVLFAHPTIATLTAELEHRLVQQYPNDCVVLLNKHRTGRPLFIVHPVGGDVFCYGRLARELWLERPVYGLRRPEIANGEAPSFITIQALASLYIEQMKLRQPKGPYFIAGWSLGGVIAHEIGVQLEMQGDHVAFVGMIDSEFFDPLVAKAIYKRMKIKASDLATVSVDTLLEKVENVKGLRRYFDLDAANLDQLDEHKRRFYTALQVLNLLALSFHKGKHQVNRICYFCAEAEIGNDKQLGRRLELLAPMAKRKIDAYRIDGDHYNIVEGDKVAGLAEALVSVLEKLAF